MAESPSSDPPVSRNPPLILQPPATPRSALPPFGSYRLIFLLFFSHFLHALILVGGYRLHFIVLDLRRSSSIGFFVFTMVVPSRSCPVLFWTALCWAGLGWAGLSDLIRSV